ALLFILGLFPALGFFNYLPMRYSFVADHFQYIASAALIAGGVWWLHRFFTSAMRFTIASGLILGALTAMTFAQNHVYTSPLALWSDTVNKNPTSWAAWNNLGVLERNMGNLPDAEHDLKRSIEIRPDNADAMMNLGVLEQMRGNLDGAIDDLKKAAEIAQDDPIHGAANSRIYYHLGVVYKLKGDLDTSFIAFRDAVELDRRNLDAINSCGAVLMEKGRLELAKAWFDRALAIDPLFLPAHANLGNLYWRQQDIPKAQEEYYFVLHNDRRNVVALDGMGRVSAALGQWEVAVRYFKMALDVDPDFSEAQRNLIAAVRHMEAATKPSTQPATTRSTSAPATEKSQKP